MSLATRTATRYFRSYTVRTISARLIAEIMPQCVKLSENGRQIFLWFGFYIFSVFELNDEIKILESYFTKHSDLCIWYIYVYEPFSK